MTKAKAKAEVSYEHVVATIVDVFSDLEKFDNFIHLYNDPEVRFGNGNWRYLRQRGYSALQEQRKAVLNRLKREEEKVTSVLFAMHHNSGKKDSSTFVQIATVIMTTEAAQLLWCAWSWVITQKKPKTQA